MGEMMRQFSSCFFSTISALSVIMISTTERSPDHNGSGPDGSYTSVLLRSSFLTVTKTVHARRTPTRNIAVLGFMSNSVLSSANVKQQASAREHGDRKGYYAYRPQPFSLKRIDSPHGLNSHRPGGDVLLPARKPVCAVDNHVCVYLG